MANLTEAMSFVGPAWASSVPSRETAGLASVSESLMPGTLLDLGAAAGVRAMAPNEALGRPMTARYDSIIRAMPTMTSITPATGNTHSGTPACGTYTVGSSLRAKTV